MFDMSIRSRHIHDQSRKLSEIAPNFGRFFSPSQILGSEPSKSYTHFVGTATLHRATLNRPTVIRAHTLNFRPNFKFSGLNFLRGPPSQLWCALASLGQPVTRVKFERAAPQRPKFSLAQDVCLGWSIWAPITLLFVDQSSRIFFAQRGRDSGW